MTSVFVMSINADERTTGIENPVPRGHGSALQNLRSELRSTLERWWGSSCYNTAMEDHHLEANRRMWDERVPIHLKSDFYDVTGFLDGTSHLRDFEREELGDVRGKSLVHLQCHFGLDTLSWARLGAEVIGLDFSEVAIVSARDIAERLGLDAEFVVGDVHSAPEVLGRRFDVVYTGLGSISWLPDLDRWARVIADLLEPGRCLLHAGVSSVHGGLCGQ